MLNTFWQKNRMRQMNSDEMCSSVFLWPKMRSISIQDSQIRYSSNLSNSRPQWALELYLQKFTKLRTMLCSLTQHSSMFFSDLSSSRLFSLEVSASELFSKTCFNATFSMRCMANFQLRVIFLCSFFFLKMSALQKQKGNFFITSISKARQAISTLQTLNFSRNSWMLSSMNLRKNQISLIRLLVTTLALVLQMQAGLLHSLEWFLTSPSSRIQLLGSCLFSQTLYSNLIQAIASDSVLMRSGDWMSNMPFVYSRTFLKAKPLHRKKDMKTSHRLSAMSLIHISKRMMKLQQAMKIHPKQQMRSINGLYLCSFFTSSFQMRAKCNTKITRLNPILSALDTSSFRTAYPKISFRISFMLGPNSSQDWSFLFRFVYRQVKLKNQLRYSVTEVTKMVAAEIILTIKNQSLFMYLKLHRSTDRMGKLRKSLTQLIALRTALSFYLNEGLRSKQRKISSDRLTRHIKLICSATQF